MNSFEITIQRKAGLHWPIVVEERTTETSLEMHSEGSLDLDLEALALQMTPHDYGTVLGQAVFRDTIHDAFVRARAQSVDHLSVQLYVEAPDLRPLYWERLCAPVDGQWRFLLFDLRTPLTLALPSTADRRFPPIKRENLRALILVASPQGLERYRLSPFDSEGTVSRICAALGTIPCDVLASTQGAIGPPTLDALCEWLSNTTSFTLLHVVCHSRQIPDLGGTMLYLENEEQQVDLVTASRLLDRLSHLQLLPHFAFLMTSESANPQAEGTVGGLAQRFVRELGMPAVLAMTEKVSLSTAEAFAGTFYRQLLVHGKLDLALAEAYTRVAERPDSIVAVLYSRLGTNPLFREPLNSFEITIRNKAGAYWPIVVELSGEKTPLLIRREGLLELDLEVLSTLVTPHDYGTRLGQALFRDRIREAFLQARTQSEDCLSVQLFVEAAELRTLRWERLCAPVDEHWRFLLFDQRTPLTIALPSATDWRFPLISRADLRALLVVASPQGLERYRLAPFDVAATVASVRTALGTIPCDVLSTTPDAISPPTLDALCERLISTSYPLLHLVCHGRYSSDIGDTVLYLENEEQQIDPVTASRLLDRLAHLRGEHGLPHFAFLSTCEGANPQVEGVFSGLAQRLVRELGLPAVLAMIEPVSLRTAEALTSKFYQRLSAHGHLDLALSEACASLATWLDSTVAALYSRLGTNSFFREPLSSTSSEMLFFNGINGASGDYLLPPMTIKQIANIVQNEKQDPEQLKELRWWYQRVTQITL